MGVDNATIVWMTQKNERGGAAAHGLTGASVADAVAGDHMNEKTRTKAAVDHEMTAIVAEVDV